MSLVHEYHAAHMVRLARMSGRAAPTVEIASEPVRTKVSSPQFADAWEMLLGQYREGAVGDMTLIQRAVASDFGISIRDLVSRRRTADIVLPRQVAMYLCKTITPRSLPEIGRKFGGKDHTTVLHAIRRTEARMARDTDFARRVDRIRENVEGRAEP